MKSFILDYFIPIFIAVALAVSATYHLTVQHTVNHMFEPNALISYKEDKEACELKWDVPCVIVKHEVYGIQYYSVDPYDPPKD